MVEGYLGHKVEVAGRAREYMGLVRQAHDWAISDFAEHLGYSGSEFLDALLDGDRYHNWDELEDFSKRAGVNPEWMKHGRGEPFEVVKGFQLAELDRLGEAERAGDWRLSVVRSDCERGRVAIVVERNPLVWKTYALGIHVSEVNGAGGQIALVEFFRMLTSLLDVWKPQSFGYTIGDAEFGSLVSGEAFPGKVMQGKAFDYWIDDFIDLGPHDEGRRRQIDEHGPRFRAAQMLVRSGLERPA